MNNQLLSRWLESLQILDDSIDLFQAFISGQLAEELLFHFTGKRVNLNAKSSVDSQKQNWERILQAHQIQLRYSATQDFVNKFLNHIFDEYVFKPIALSESLILDFVQRVLSSAGLKRVSTKISDLQLDIVNQPFIEVFSCLLTKTNIKYHYHTAETIIDNYQKALPVLLNNQITVLLTAEEFQTVHPHFLAFQTYVWMAEASQRINPTQKVAGFQAQEAANVYEDVIFSYGICDEFARIVVDTDKISITKYEKELIEEGTRFNQVPDTVSIAAGGTVGYFNPVNVKLDEIDLVALEGQQLVFSSKKYCFDQIPGSGKFKVMLNSAQEALEAGKVIQSVLQ
ncbi:Hypothetical_protein [Hexamita inflata]|uniref:Hypothetical_protein n=1 Tax=Hexamita inflata TaxID=28002 RepID=A0AA86PC88_9EUKA|nr:Hypothetical protein HINF_LOCUS23548 [Hexamita inflata]